jgi:tetratricopeptide (TPR) repeat protein
LLDLVIRDVATGSVRDRISVTDTSLFGLVDRATARLLAVVDRPAGAFRFEGVETSSVEAYRTYILALDRLDAGRETEAIQLLDAAVSADSTFAAALRTRMLSLTSWTSAAQDSLRRLRDALARLQSRESDFDRRALAAVNASQQGDATRAERIARDLAQRYPRDARAQRSLISDLLNLGEFSEASRVATQALALDSAARAPGRESCATCALYGALVTTALALGDAPRAEAAARSAVAANPSEPAPWGWLSRAAEASGLHAEATSAAQEAMRLAPREASTAEAFGWLMLETGQLAVVDSLIRAWVRPGSELASIGLDLTGALLRERGEYSAAARANARAVARARSEDDSAALGLVYASSLARTGDITAARRMFEQAGHVGDSTRGSRRVLTPTLIARAFAWPHALLADALFLAGSRDTLLLLALADSIETLGSRSSLARDGRLHFHVRGLVAEIGGRWPEAERAFEQARWGRAGWTRTNVELARAQLAQGRPRNAIMTLQEKRFGSLDGMGRYAPYSEINAALAEAFLAAHLPDSARAYAAKVRPAWANADAPQRHRLSAIEQALRDASSR